MFPEAEQQGYDRKDQKSVILCPEESLFDKTFSTPITLPGMSNYPIG